jgi:hypothetical protein
VHVESLEGIMRLSVSKDLWFYLVITAPLMFVTILGWRLWEFMIRSRTTAVARQHDEEG